MKYMVLTTPLAAAAMAQFVLDQNTVNLVVAFVATVGLVVAAMRWIDRRIEHKIANYAQLASAQHAQVLREISVLREVMGLRPLQLDEHGALAPKVEGT